MVNSHFWLVGKEFQVYLSSLLGFPITNRFGVVFTQYGILLIFEHFRLYYAQEEEMCYIYMHARRDVRLVSQ